MSTETDGRQCKVLPHSPERRRFSVLCYRGWCDYEFKIRDIPGMVSALTGKAYPPATHLRRSECPIPETCECECHDAPKVTAKAAAGHDRRYRCAKALLVFTITDGDGSERCVTCGRVLTR